jgi:hypothetical protein
MPCWTGGVITPPPLPIRSRGFASLTKPATMVSGWRRGERRHCRMVALPTREAEDGKRPLRERDRLVTDATRWSTPNEKTPLTWKTRLLRSLR